MKVRKILAFCTAALLMLTLAITLAACGKKDVDVSFTDISANGESETVTTTEITLTFDQDITNLTASNITVTGATKGALTGTGTTRVLAISNITVEDGEDITVTISNPTGFKITPSSKTVAVNVAEVIELPIFSSLEEFLAAISDEFGNFTLDYTFDSEALGNEHEVYKLQEECSYHLNENDIAEYYKEYFFRVNGEDDVDCWYREESDVDFDYYHYADVIHPFVESGAFIIIKNLIDNEAFTPNDNVYTLTEAFVLTEGPLMEGSSVLDGTITIGATEVTIECTIDAMFTEFECSMTFSLFGETVVNVSAIPGTEVELVSIEANGASEVTTTTELTIIFDVPVISLTADNFTVTGATKGLLTGSGTIWYLAISDITVEDGENITVAITNPTGFNITPTSQTVAVYVETVVEEEWLMARLWFWDGDDYVEYSESILTQLYGDDEILDIEVDEGGTTVADIIALYIELGGIQGSKIPVGEPFFDEFAYGIAAQVYDLLGVDLIESISSELSGIMVAGGVTLNLYFGEPSPFIVIESFPYSISLDFSTIDNTTPFMFVFTLEEETTLDITCGHPAMNRYIRIYDNASLVDPMFASGNNIYAETFDAGTYYVVVEKNSGPDITETFSVSVAVE